MVAALIACFTISGLAAEQTLKETTFLAICSGCGATNALKPMKGESHGGVKVPGGFTNQMTLTFKCPEKRCKKRFTQGFDVYMADRPKAVPLLPPTPLPPLPRAKRTVKEVGQGLAVELREVDSLQMSTWVPDESGNGSGSLGVTAYSGPAIVLTASGISESNGGFVERSTDLQSWSAYPSDGFQLTLLPTNPSSTVPIDTSSPTVFYRVRIASVSQ